MKVPSDDPSSVDPLPSTLPVDPFNPVVGLVSDPLDFWIAASGFRVESVTEHGSLSKSLNSSARPFRSLYGRYGSQYGENVFSIESSNLMTLCFSGGDNDLSLAS